MTTEEFIHKCTELHGDMYNYDAVIYVNRYTKVIITCTQCDTTYSITPMTFCRPHKCKWCIALARKQQQEKISAEKQGKKEKQQQANSIKSNNKRVKKEKTSNNTRTHRVKTPPQPQARKKKKRTKYSRWRDSSWKKAGEHSKAFHAFAVYIILCYDEGTDEKFIKVGKTFRTVESRFEAFPYKWILLAYWSGSAEQASSTEREMHGLYKEYKYIPQKPFGGQSECFSMDMLNNINTEKDIHEQTRNMAKTAINRTQ